MMIVKPAVFVIEIYQLLKLTFQKLVVGFGTHSDPLKPNKLYPFSLIVAYLQYLKSLVP